LLAVLVWRHRDPRMPADFSGAPRQGVLQLGVGFALFAVPWWLHHLHAVGSPFFNLTSYMVIGNWHQRPDISVMQDFALTPKQWPATLAAELPHMAGKWIVFFPHAVKNALFSPSGATGWLAPIGAVAACAA